MSNNRHLMVGAIAGFVVGTVLHLVLPAILGVMLAGGASGLTILDPLYAGERIDAISEIYRGFLIFQAVQAIIPATITGITAAYLSRHIKSGWIFLLAPIAGLVIHGAISALTFLVMLLFSSSGIGLVMSTSMLISLVVGPLIGLVGVFLVNIFASERKAEQAE